MQWPTACAHSARGSKTPAMSRARPTLGAGGKKARFCCADLVTDHVQAAAEAECLPLPPSLHQLIRDGLDEVRDRGAVAGLDEGLDWHAGHQLEALEAGNFAVRKHDPDGVETCPFRLIFRLILSDVGRDAAHFAVEL